MYTIHNYLIINEIFAFISIKFLIIYFFNKEIHQYSPLNVAIEYEKIEIVKILLQNEMIDINSSVVHI